MLKRIASVLFAGAVLLGGSVYAEKLSYDFSVGDAGFLPIFADYPAADGSDDFYELEYGRKRIPIKDAKGGLYISGNNHSDDLFMGYYKELDGFKPNKGYSVDVTFTLATNEDGGMMGIGGSLGSSVYVKCGIVSHKPDRVKTDLNGYRLNIDKGNQGSDGKDMKLVGTIEKHETLFPGEYEFNDYRATLEVTADADGRAYLIIGTDSGFEGTTAYYIADVEIDRSEKNAYTDIIGDADYVWEENISRLQFCEFVYNMANSAKELPAVSPAPFEDVSNSKITALAAAGLVSGRGNRMFDPDGKITREEAAAILGRAAEYAGIKLPEGDFDSEYSDSGDISNWAVRAVYGLKKLNVIENADGVLFMPKANYTVGEAVRSVVKLHALCIGS